MTENPGAQSGHCRQYKVMMGIRATFRYELLNPEECGQKYHYGYIQLEALDYGTRVNQVTYFDFFGVSVWVNYPFKGGMTQVLNYTARWEQEYISEFGYQYKN